MTNHNHQKWLPQQYEAIRKKLELKYDFSLFKTLTDAEFGRKYKISPNSARKLRKRYASDTNSLDIYNEKIRQQHNEKINKTSLLVLEYIKRNPLQLSPIEFRNLHNIKDSRVVNRKFIEQVARDNKIEVSFKIDNSKKAHGLYCKSKVPRCNCDIFRVAKSLAMYGYRKKIKIGNANCNLFANKYLNEWNSDTSNNHCEFYKMILEKLKEQTDAKTSTT